MALLVWSVSAFQGMPECAHRRIRRVRQGQAPALGGIEHERGRAFLRVRQPLVFASSRTPWGPKPESKDPVGS